MMSQKSSFTQPSRFVSKALTPNARHLMAVNGLIH
jgi:hypothetical protein